MKLPFQWKGKESLTDIKNVEVGQAYKPKISSERIIDYPTLRRISSYRESTIEVSAQSAVINS